MSRTVEAINASDITTIGVIVILALVVLGFLIGLVISAVVARVVIALVVVVLAIVVWQQRGHVQDKFTKKACDFDTTFFGVHLDPPDDVKHACATRS